LKRVLKVVADAAIAFKDVKIEAHGGIVLYDEAMG
jgi:hypothetical protein